MTRDTFATTSPVAWIALAADGVIVRVVARPGSSRRGIVGSDPRGLIVAMHAPPAQGRANDDLIDVLAHALRRPRSAISLIRGATGRTKTLRIASNDPAGLAAKLASLAGSGDQASANIKRK